MSVDVPLHMITNDLSPAHVTSCVEAECTCSTFACSWNASFVVRLVFHEISSLSNPMEARYCIVPRNCVQKDDVLAYVRSSPLLHSHDVPYARLFCILLWIRAKEVVMRHQSCMVAKENNMSVSSVARPSVQ